MSTVLLDIEVKKKVSDFSPNGTGYDSLGWSAGVTPGTVLGKPPALKGRDKHGDLSRPFRAWRCVSFSSQDCVAPALHSILGYHILSRWDWAEIIFLNLYTNVVSFLFKGDTRATSYEPHLLKHGKYRLTFFAPAPKLRARPIVNRLS